MTPKEKALRIRNTLPSEGLFANKQWRIAPEPFLIPEKLHEKITQLGPRLHKFYQACNLLYRQSTEGKQPSWIASYLDAGKPDWLIQIARDRHFKNDLPIVIRPDLLLTEDSFAITELDSVPGGIGVTAWMQEAYNEAQALKCSMLDGFLSAIGSLHQPESIAIVVSDEAKDYFPEMQWIAENAQARNANIAVCKPEDLKIDSSGVFLREQKIDVIYRFFELFDLENIPNSKALIQSVLDEKVKITPPLKPQLEEKLWFALFWFPQLADFWRRELGDRYFRDLKEHIPFTWLLDPTPLPPHAVLPQLEIQDWQQLKKLSQKQRDLILKISGFSELAWGSRGVFLGGDMSADDWSRTVQTALDSFAHHPYILQRFAPSSLFRHSWYDFSNDQIETLHGRIRLCPYFFLKHDKPELAGILTTICPADKKLIHGMEDAILTLGYQDAGHHFE